MRQIPRLKHIVPAAVLASMVLAVAGTAAFAAGGVSAADPAPACVAPTGTVTNTQRITYLECQMKAMDATGHGTRADPHAHADPHPTRPPSRA